MNSTRPRFWRIWLGFALLMVVFQIGAALRVLQLPEDLIAQVSLLLPLEVVVSILWAAAFAWGARGIWRSQHFALRRLMWMLVGFLIYTTLHRIMFSRADYDRGRLPFLVTVVIIFVGINLIAFVMQRQTHSTLRENASHGSKS